MHCENNGGERRGGNRSGNSAKRIYKGKNTGKWREAVLLDQMIALILEKRDAPGMGYLLTNFN